MLPPCKVETLAVGLGMASDLCHSHHPSPRGTLQMSTPSHSKQEHCTIYQEKTWEDFNWWIHYFILAEWCLLCFPSPLIQNPVSIWGCHLFSCFFIRNGMDKITSRKTLYFICKGWIYFSLLGCSSCFSILLIMYKTFSAICQQIWCNPFIFKQCTIPCNSENLCFPG